MSDKFILTGIEIFGYHGDLPEERKLGQKFLVDLELNLDLSIAGKSDELSDTVDYPQILALVITSIFAVYFGKIVTRKLGGVTGDIYGATELLSETSVLTIFLLLN